MSASAPDPLLARVEGARHALKVFPLPGAVLFPGAALPLHIFEPRYRALVKDALASDGVMAIAQLQPGWEEGGHGGYAGRPPMAPLVCAGVIAWHEALEDGRYNLLLHGVVRARTEAELPPERLYREVRAALVPDAPYRGSEEEELRNAVLELAGRVPPAMTEGLLPLTARTSGGALADVVAAALVQDPERRQALLEELRPDARLRALLDDVGDLLVRLAPSKRTGPLN